MKEDKPDKLVTIAAFAHPIQAHLARTKLASAGIVSFLADEHIASMDLHFSSVVGGIKLKVERAAAPTAVKILGLESSSDYPEEAENITGHGPGLCPVCGSGEFIPRGLLSRLASVLPLPFYKPRLGCARCGHAKEG
jgi:hypothetical protein